MADLADRHANFKELGAELVTISTDTKFVHLAWQRNERSLEKAKFIMGSDPTGEVSKLFGVYDEKCGLALRGTFIINPAGILLASEVNFYNVGRNVDELLRRIKANIHVARHSDEACPARWDEGEKTLKPSEKMVGKVYEALH
jgi:peroxiredoxin (alkyl hydroperoxide reductase subunit C)